MAHRNLLIGGLIVMGSTVLLLAGMLIAQAGEKPLSNRFPPDPGGSWHKVFINGQSLTVWGRKNEKGIVNWFPDSQPPLPLIDQPPLPVKKPEADRSTPTGRPKFETNGVQAEKLATDRVIRASDPETLRMVMESVEKPCKPDRPSDAPVPEKGPLAEIKDAIERGILIAVGVVLILVAGVIVLRK